jgi:hypothetical protein
MSQKKIEVRSQKSEAGTRAAPAACALLGAVAFLIALGLRLPAQFTGPGGGGGSGATSASAPLVLNSKTGNLTCADCATLDGDDNEFTGAYGIAADNGFTVGAGGNGGGLYPGSGSTSVWSPGNENITLFDGTGGATSIYLSLGPVGSSSFMNIASYAVSSHGSAGGQNDVEVTTTSLVDPTSTYGTQESAFTLINPANPSPYGNMISSGCEGFMPNSGALSPTAAFGDAGSYGCFGMDHVTNATLWNYGYGSTWGSSLFWEWQVPQYENAALLPQSSVVSGGTAPTVTGCGAISAQVGGALAGSFVTSATSCTPVLTNLPASASGYSCLIWDVTHYVAPLGNVDAGSNTSATFPTFTTTASDKLRFQCGLSY